MDYSYVNQRITVSGAITQKDLSEISRIGVTAAVLIRDVGGNGYPLDSLIGSGVECMEVIKEEGETWSIDELERIAAAGLVEITRGGKLLIVSPHGYRRAVIAAVAILIRLGANARPAEAAVRGARRSRARIEEPDRDALHNYHRHVNGLRNEYADD